MNNLPPSPTPRYQKIKKLSHSGIKNEVTYLATDTKTNKSVVIKQFKFAQSVSSSSNFKTYEREIQILSLLQHPGIPRYLNSFETSNGFCLVQEYKEAQSLAITREFSIEQIKKVTTSILEILIYLQTRTPAIIHRDIKPENILVDDQLNVYLINFGFARSGSGEGAVSSIMAGSFGFMASEQLYNKNLSLATDLYGLGATIICLLTGTKSNEIGTLINDSGQINFKSLLSQFDSSVIEWLDKMVEPKQKERYSSAEEALKQLNHLSFKLIPKVDFNSNVLIFQSNQIDEKITQIITITNPVSQTLLEGNWKVLPHPNDPNRKSDHPWISFTPVQFQSNQINCSITVDTSKLITNHVYERKILLETNSEPSQHKLTLKIHTAIIHIHNTYYYVILLTVSILIMTFIPILITPMIPINPSFDLLESLKSRLFYHLISSAIVLIPTIPTYLLCIIECRKLGVENKIIENSLILLIIILLIGLNSNISPLPRFITSMVRILIIPLYLITVINLIRIFYKKTKDKINKYYQSINNRIKP